MRLSEKQRNEPPVKLTRAEKREIQAIIRKYKGDGKAHSAQASIPYQAMYPDGVCRVTANTFSKCIEFADISYQLAQADTKTAIFENLCDLYNYTLDKYDTKVSNLYIAQVKEKYGIIERENYNKPKSENSKQPQCPAEKVEMIEEALRHFKMI